MRWAAAIAIALVGCGARDRAPSGAAMAVVGESTKLRAGDPLPATSTIFDGTTVRLRGARGEVLGVQVLRADPAATTASLIVDGAAVTGFVVDHHDVRSPSTAMYGPSRGRGRYPDRLTPHDGAVPTTRAAYFDVAIARDAAPGRHRGELVIGAQRLPVELTIDRAELDDLGAAPRVWGYYDVSLVARMHDTVGDEIATLLVERTYAALFRAHGVVASPELTPSTWATRQTMVAGLPYVPVLLPAERDALTTEVQGWATRLDGTGQVAFAIPIDEPRSAAAQAQVRERSAWVRAAGGGPGRFLYAVTHEPSPALGDAIDVYISPFAVRPDADYTAWTYNGTPPWAGSMIVDTDGTALRTWGWIAFLYDVPLWYVWDVLFWADRYHRGRAALPHDLLAEPVTFDDGEDHGNLDGVLAFPGPLPSLRLKALRRGLSDRALLDAYARCAGRPAARALARTMVPRALGEARRGDRAAWPTDEAAWEIARHQILDGLARCS